MSDLDQIDLKLLELLQQNGKLTTKEIAKQVNLSPTPVDILKHTKENISNQVCELVSKRYQTKPFYRYAVW